MSENYLTPEQVMKRLHIGKSTLYRRVADGTLPEPIRIGKLQRFRESELAAALDELGDRRSTD